MQAKLIVVGGKADQSEIDLQLPTTIGRQRDSDLVIVHKSVSRLHCQLFERNGSLIVRDNNSSNGTYINDLQVFEAVIRPGDLLRVGPLTFEARYNLVRPARARPEPIPLERPPIREAELDIDPDAVPDVPAPTASDESDELDLSAWNLNMAEGGDQESGDDEAPFVFSDSPDDSLIGQQMAADAAADKPKSKVEFDFEDWGLSEEEKVGETVDSDVPELPPQEPLNAPKAENRTLEGDFTGFKPGAATNADSSSIGIVSHDFDDPVPKKTAKPKPPSPPPPAPKPMAVAKPASVPNLSSSPAAKPVAPAAKPVAPVAKPVTPPPAPVPAQEDLSDESDDFSSWMSEQAKASDIASPAPDAATSSPPEPEDLDILQEDPIEITADDLAPDSQIGQLSPIPSPEKKIPDPIVDDFNSWGKENIDSDSDFDSDIESVLPSPTPEPPSPPPAKRPHEEMNSFFSSFVEGDSFSIDEEKSAFEKKPAPQPAPADTSPEVNDEVSELTVEDIADSGIHQSDFLTPTDGPPNNVSNDVEDDPAQFNFDNWK